MVHKVKKLPCAGSLLFSEAIISENKQYENAWQIIKNSTKRGQLKPLNHISYREKAIKAKVA